MAVVAGANALMSPGRQLSLPQPRVKSLRGMRVALRTEDLLAPDSQETAKRVQAIRGALRVVGQAYQ